jgi:hypothetical protein
MLQTDDLEKGLFVTVIQGPRLSKTLVNTVGMSENEVSQEDRSFQGDVLLISSVNLPFVTVRQKSLFGNENFWTMSLDTRIFKFIKLNEDYCKEILGNNYEQFKQNLS